MNKFTDLLDKTSNFFKKAFEELNITKSASQGLGVDLEHIGRNIGNADLKNKFLNLSKEYDNFVSVTNKLFNGGTKNYDNNLKGLKTNTPESINYKISEILSDPYFKNELIKEKSITKVLDVKDKKNESGKKKSDVEISYEALLKIYDCLNNIKDHTAKIQQNIIESIDIKNDEEDIEDLEDPIIPSDLESVYNDEISPQQFQHNTNYDGSATTVVQPDYQEEGSNSGFSFTGRKRTLNDTEKAMAKQKAKSAREKAKAEFYAGMDTKGAVSIGRQITERKEKAFELRNFDPILEPEKQEKLDEYRQTNVKDKDKSLKKREHEIINNKNVEQAIIAIKAHIRNQLGTTLDNHITSYILTLDIDPIYKKYWTGKKDQRFPNFKKFFLFFLKQTDLGVHDIIEKDIRNIIDPFQNSEYYDLKLTHTFKKWGWHPNEDCYQEVKKFIMNCAKYREWGQERSEITQGFNYPNDIASYQHADDGM